MSNTIPVAVEGHIGADTRRTDELGQEKITKLLVQYALPSVVGMLVMSLYNLIDSIFIGRGVGPMALSALALAIPVMNLSAAFSVLIGVGASAQMSIRLGKGDKESARLILGNMVMLNIVIGALFTIVSLVYLDDLLILIGATPNTIGYGREFLSIILWGNIVGMTFMGLNSLMRSTGYPRKSMYVTIISIAVNAALAPLFIFAFKWGVRGAALATLLAQFTGLVLEIIHYSNKKHFVHFRREIFRINKQIVNSILRIGMSPFVLNLCTSIVVILLNRALLAQGGDVYVGAYGIINRWVFLFTMTVIGINQGVQPIMGYNYGAGKLDRMAKAFKQAVAVGICITSLGGFSAMIFPETIARMFTGDAAMIAATVEGLQYTLIIFPIVAFQMIASSFFMSIDMARKSVFISVTRQVLLLVPLLLILPPKMGVIGVWISMPIADGLSIILSAVMVATQFRRMLPKHTQA